MTPDELLPERARDFSRHPDGREWRKGDRIEVTIQMEDNGHAGNYRWALGGSTEFCSSAWLHTHARSVTVLPPALPAWLSTVGALATTGEGERERFWRRDPIWWGCLNVNMGAFTDAEFWALSPVHLVPEGVQS